MAKAKRSVQINETLSVKLSGKKSLRLCDDYCDGNPTVLYLDEQDIKAIVIFARQCGMILHGPLEDQQMTTNTELVRQLREKHGGYWDNITEV